jgi:signal transduction histidine kinase
MPFQGDRSAAPGRQLPDNMIRAIEEDRRGRIWVGTRYQGIAVIDRGTIRRISTDGGLINNSIWAFAEDHDGSMWVATALGLQKVSPETYEPSQAEESLLGRPVASVGAGPDGSIWFTTPEALRVFRYHRDKDLVKPPVYITHMSANTVPVATPGPVELSYDQNNVEVAFTGVSFVPSRGLTYQHRLLGADDRWRDAADARTALFLALEPGSYAFEVRAGTPGGDGYGPAAQVHFTVRPPFWRQWWFIATNLLGAFGIGYLLLLVRQRRLLMIERLRSRISRDLHDEIGSNLTGIAMSSQLILRQKKLPAGARSRLAEIRETAQHTSELMRDIVWLVNPGNDSIDELILWMKTTAFSILGPIEHTFSSPSFELRTSIDLAVKRSLFLIYKEALTNVAKHARATHVRIAVHVDGDVFSIRIEDNGVGPGRPTSSGGNGLRNMHARAAEIGGTCTVGPGVERGTTVSVRARITQMRNGLSR